MGHWHTHTCKLNSAVSVDSFDVLQKGGAHTLTNPLFVVMH